MEENKKFMEECFNRYVKLRTLQKKNKDSKEYHYLIAISKNMINLYLENAENIDYKDVIEKLKMKYIKGESKIENNETKEEKKGIGVIYDFICDYDFTNRHFNIFVDSMQIHMHLYSKMLGKEFGGKIRTEQAVLADTNIEVMTPDDARAHYNSYIPNSDKIMSELDKKDIFDYIKGCLIIMTDLIKTQPFADGNKRTFRSLFNLMLKRKNLPPVYLGDQETEFLSKALLKAMIEENYTDLYELYLRLICDSIVMVGLKEMKTEKSKK